jgi:hypothetical protein
MFTFVSQNKQIYLMIEKIAQFNAKMIELGINPNSFFVISFWGNQDIQCQGNYTDILAKKLYDLGYEGKLQNNGHIRFITEGMQFTLC